jgi:hypothetical protein
MDLHNKISIVSRQVEYAPAEDGLVATLSRYVSESKQCFDEWRIDDLYNDLFKRKVFLENFSKTYDALSTIMADYLSILNTCESLEARQIIDSMRPRGLEVKPILVEHKQVYAHTMGAPHTLGTSHTLGTPHIPAVTAVRDSTVAIRDTTTAARERTVRPSIAPAKKLQLAEISITSGMTLPAYKISNLASAPIGYLCYSDDLREFVMKLHGNIALRGNIGIIFGTGESVYNARPCTFQAQCNSIGRCQFWHNPRDLSPAINAKYGSPMNFTAHSWLYDPTRGGKRVFGSLNNLSTDIANVNASNMFIYERQIMHDLLCSMLMRKYAPKSQ